MGAYITRRWDVIKGHGTISSKKIRMRLSLTGPGVLSIDNMDIIQYFKNGWVFSPRPRKGKSHCGTYSEALIFIILSMILTMSS